MYDKLGRAALRFTLIYLRRRYRREIRIAAGLGIAVIGIAIYIANRDAPEG